MEALSDFFTKAIEAPHNAYVFLDHSDNVLAKQVVQLLNTPAVVAFYAKLTSLLSNYSHLIIPFIGLIAQLTMSSYTRKWTLEKAEKREAEARKVLLEQKQKAQREAEGKSATLKPTATATATGAQSGSSPAKTAKGKKGNK
ncbi:BZ3500_MvSof-1268-A1-R1_Chr9g10461 [Microbotryum saponariae]|uniref:BZ3500_MvSof-1268-A1-R1_Chr9g10461 protein n=1 Tax=Microbotryum saponariae TaxID=289078 RepID=A0A2X0KTR2_9BASI|nr:BZ3501_MvSof-1269-A2-R1_Chr9g10211 [Microbotryum saponariae]SDA00129.1 BZ3500_MvSof-1268-A1-R1_Chr9g10461 [Microbotryum saponariae]